MRLFGKRSAGRKAAAEERYSDLMFTFPFYVKVYGSASDEDPYTELSGKAAYDYMDEDVKEDICFDFNTSSLNEYYSGSRVRSMRMVFSPEGYVLIRVSLPQEESAKESGDIRSFLIGQLSDGWGEHYEGLLYDHVPQFYPPDHEEKYTVSFWKYIP